MAHGLSCSAACGIFPDQGSNPCLLHWQADSQPLHHQGSPPSLSLEDSDHVPRGWGLMAPIVGKAGWELGREVPLGDFTLI